MGLKWNPLKWNWLVFKNFVRWSKGLLRKKEEKLFVWSFSRCKKILFSEWVFHFYFYINYFLIRKLKQKQPYLFTLDKREENKYILIGIVYWLSSSRLSSFVQHVVGDVNLDAQEKLFVITIVTRNSIVWKLTRGYCLCYCKTFLLVPGSTECTNIFVAAKCITLFMSPKIK